MRRRIEEQRQSLLRAAQLEEQAKAKAREVERKLILEREELEERVKKEAEAEGLSGGKKKRKKILARLPN
jgi:Fe-S cluster assembly ATPase SufC